MVKGEQLNRLLAGYLDRGETNVGNAISGWSPLLTDTRGLLLRLIMAARFIVMITTMWIFNCNVWFDFSIWHSGRLRQFGIHRLWKFHDFLNALASAKTGKQPGSDGVVVELVRALSWSTLP